MNKKNSTREESPVFLYEHVKIKIREMIASGEIKPSEKLPNENELCELFDASRITIRRAIKELASEGVLEILHGKGTFVKRAKQQIHILDLNGFTDGMWIGKNNITKEILSKKVMLADDKLMKLFERDEPFEVLELVRLIRDSDLFFSVDYSYLPLDIYPGISEKIHDNVSTFKIIHNEYGIMFKKASKSIEIMQPSEEIIQLLDISRLETVIQINKVIKDERNNPVHYSLYYYLANNVKFHIDFDMKEDLYDDYPKF